MVTVEGDFLLGLILCSHCEVQGCMASQCYTIPLIGILAATSVTAQGSHLLKNYSIGTWNLGHSTTFRTVIAIFSPVVPSMGRWPLKGMKCQRDPKGAKGATSPHHN